MCEGYSREHALTRSGSTGHRTTTLRRVSESTKKGIDHRSEVLLAVAGEVHARNFEADRAVESTPDLLSGLGAVARS